MSKRKFYKRINDILNDVHEYKYIYLDGKKTRFIIYKNGRIFSTNYNKSGMISEIVPQINKDGHYTVVFSVDGKSYCRRVHRLLALAFIPVPEKYISQGLTVDDLEVHHKDGNRLHNDLANLEWLTPYEHKMETKALGQYHGMPDEKSPLCKYSNKQIEEVCRLLEENKKTMREISEITGVSYPRIQLIRYRPEARRSVKANFNIDNYNCFSFHKDETIHEVCRLLQEGKLTMRQISEYTGVHYQSVKDIRSRRVWKRISKDYKF